MFNWIFVIILDSISSFVRPNLTQIYHLSCSEPGSGINYVCQACEKKYWSDINRFLQKMNECNWTLDLCLQFSSFSNKISHRVRITCNESYRLRYGLKSFVPRDQNVKSEIRIRRYGFRQIRIQKILWQEQIMKSSFKHIIHKIWIKLGSNIPNSIWILSD